MTNRGLNLEKQKLDRIDTDWKFGSSSKTCIALIPENEREQYLPSGERQNIGSEKMDCATRGPINILETKFTYLYRNNKLSPRSKEFLNQYVIEGSVRFSDRFIAKLSGTTTEGNSMKAPIDAIHRFGLIPKDILPQVDTWDEYYSDGAITRYMMNLGEEFNKYFTINYEEVNRNDFKDLLNTDIINVAGHAWPFPEDGIYPKTENRINHVFIIYKKPFYYAFDNYVDSYDGDFIKRLSEDYNMLEYGYRLYITENTDYRESIFKKIVKFILSLWK